MFLQWALCGGPSSCEGVRRKHWKLLRVRGQRLARGLQETEQEKLTDLGEELTWRDRCANGWKVEHNES
jgi:hypothetical protein